MLTYSIQSQNCQVETIAPIEGCVMFLAKTLHTTFRQQCRAGLPRHVRQTKERATTMKEGFTYAKNFTRHIYTKLT